MAAPPRRCRGASTAPAVSEIALAHWPTSRFLLFVVSFVPLPLSLLVVAARSVSFALPGLF